MYIYPCLLLIIKKNQRYSRTRKHNLLVGAFAGMSNLDRLWKYAHEFTGRELIHDPLILIFFIIFMFSRTIFIFLVCTLRTNFFR
jgi:hypothetical protein